MPDLQRFIASHNSPRQRWAIVTQRATVTRDGNWIVPALLAYGVDIQKILTPEHGISAQAEDGHTQHNGFDARTGLPVISLYGDRLAPDETDLSDVDAIVVDLPNIGCRFYTYWWTITYVMEACAQFRKRLVILDRPNWRSKCTTEGPVLAAGCASFLGRWPMPVTYTLTYGELAQHFTTNRKLHLDLHVVPTQEPLVFIPPSPSIGSRETIQLYPATGLLEGVNISEGRGTAFPFRVMGAPWLRGADLFAAVAGWQTEGLRVSEFCFLPMWGIHAGKYCEGLYLEVTDPLRFRPVAFGLRLLNYLGMTYPHQLTPRSYPTAANPTGANHLDRLTGIPNAYDTICCQGWLSRAAIDALTAAPPGSW